MTRDDLPLLHRWLNDPLVVRWWEGDDVSWLGVVRDYGDVADDPEEHHIAVHEGRDVGWIQCYAVADVAGDPEQVLWARAGVSPRAAGIDYLLGREHRHRGLGPAMVRAYVEQVVFGEHPGWDEVCASPHRDNAASWRTLERAGFTTRATLFDADGAWRLMVRRRDEGVPLPGHPLARS
jgi:RimJ/RimL family protein N-acetyltransferase